MLKLQLFGRFRAEDGRGNEIPIKSRKARALLAYLALPLGKPRSREAITALLWSERGDEQARGSLRQVLSGLRQDLGLDGAEALLVTHEDVALNPSHVIVDSPAPGDELLEGLGVNDPAFDEWLRDERLRLEGETQHQAEQGPPPLPRKPSIAVLPFVNLSNDPEQDYFADGLTDDVIRQLARFRSLFVIGSTSSFQYKGRAPSVDEVGLELGVAYVARGSVRKAGDNLRISVELTEAATGQQLWAERYDGELKGIFEFQDEVAGKVVSTLAGQVEGADRSRATSKRSADLASYELVLLGEGLERKFTKEGVIQARSLFHQAIERDPRNARAHASMARTYLDEFWSVWSTDRDTAAEMAFQWAQKAVALDAFDNRARTNLAVAYHFHKGDFEAAKTQFAKALELNPNDPDAYCLQGWCHVYAGEGDDAIACTNNSMRLTPLDTYDCYLAQFFVHYGAGRYAEALTSLGQITDPGYGVEAYRAACCAQLGREDEARSAMAAYMAAAKEEIALWPDEDPEAWRQFWAKSQPFKASADLESLLEGFRKAGMPVS